MFYLHIYQDYIHWEMNKLNKANTGDLQEQFCNNILFSEHNFPRISAFWRDVPAALVTQLEQDWSYKHDLEMLGFSSTQYFDSIQLPSSPGYEPSTNTTDHTTWSCSVKYGTVSQYLINSLNNLHD